jgi:hypothetical protein
LTTEHEHPPETGLAQDLAKLLFALQVPLGDGILRDAEIPLIEIRRKLHLHGFCNEVQHLDAVEAALS